MPGQPPPILKPETLLANLEAVRKRRRSSKRSRDDDEPKLEDLKAMLRDLQEVGRRRHGTMSPVTQKVYDDLVVELGAEIEALRKQ